MTTLENSHKDHLHCTRKPKKCPSCGFRPIAKILYGYPMYDKKIKKEIDDKVLVLGGCCVFDDSPTWKCTNCGLNILKVEKENIQE